MWLAGGGIKPGMTYGATDEFSYNVAENGVHVHDLQPLSSTYLESIIRASRTASRAATSASPTSTATSSGQSCLKTTDHNEARPSADRRKKPRRALITKDASAA